MVLVRVARCLIPLSVRRLKTAWWTEQLGLINVPGLFTALHECSHQIILSGPFSPAGFHIGKMKFGEISRRERSDGEQYFAARRTA